MAASLSLHRMGQTLHMGERLDSNQQPWAYEARALPLSYAPGMWTPGIEPGLRALQTRALPIELSPPEIAREIFFSATSGNRTRNLSVDNRMLSPIELWRRWFSSHWSRQDSNLHCAAPEAAASAVGLLDRTVLPDGGLTLGLRVRFALALLEIADQRQVIEGLIRRLAGGRTFVGFGWRVVVVGFVEQGYQSPHKAPH
jgi:hypothetical protein